MPKTLTYIEILSLPLCQQALVMEERRHKARLQELKDMATSLAALQAMQTAIKDAGHTLYADAISPVHGKRQTLRIFTTFTSAEISLAKALLTVGFAIVDRDEGRLGTVLFKKDRLSVQVFMSQENLARAEGEFETALIAAAAVTTPEAA